MPIDTMTIQEALQRANNAGRGSLSDLETLLKGLAEGAVYDTYAGNPTSNVTPKAKGTWVLDTTNNIWYRAKNTADTDWIAIGTHGLTAAELAYLNGVTIGTGLASKALILDSSGRVSIPSIMATEDGAGISNGTGTIHATSVQKIGGIFYTRILMDMTGLKSATSDLDIIGDPAGGPDASYIGQITAAVNGTILGGFMTCLELPASLTDIDLYSASEATGAHEIGVATLTETALLTKGGAWAAGDTTVLSAFPAADEYLYLVNGAIDTADDFTAGRFLIELWGT